MVVLALAVPLLVLADAGPSAPRNGAEADASAMRAARMSFPTAVGPGSRPNIVLVTTDDQRLDDLAFMPRTRAVVGDAGVTLERAISPHPLCCPARVEILTGQYAQNNGVRHNSGRWGGYRAFARTPGQRRHLGSRLQDAGYRTALVGKFLNGYESVGSVQPGWTDWNPLLEGVYRYTDFTMRVDGRKRSYSTRRGPRQYVSDVVGRRAASLVRRYAGARPFFIWVSHVAPHTARRHGSWVPPVPAARHRSMFTGTASPAADLPSFLEADRSDKPSQVRGKKPRSRKHFLTLFRQRIRSLQAVDEANARVLRALADTGELSQTIVVFTSDNGYLLGEHGLQGKNWVYESSLRVPMLVRGPGIAAGGARDRPATLVDLAPTFLSLAGASASGVDGLDLWPTLASGAPTTDTDLVQAGSAHHPWRWRGVRTNRYVYTRWFSGTEELYDLQRDPYELENVVAPGGEVGDPSYAPVLSELRARYEQRASCSGAACRTVVGPVPTPGG
jgi:N-acetylglucosamine-6-sulfatase